MRALCLWLRLGYCALFGTLFLVLIAQIFTVFAILTYKVLYVAVALKDKEMVVRLIQEVAVVRYDEQAAFELL